jgi:hypothetical protein
VIRQLILGETDGLPEVARSSRRSVLALPLGPWAGQREEVQQIAVGVVGEYLAQPLRLDVAIGKAVTRVW